MTDITELDNYELLYLLACRAALHLNAELRAGHPHHLSTLAVVDRTVTDTVVISFLWSDPDETVEVLHTMVGDVPVTLQADGIPAIELSTVDEAEALEEAFSEATGMLI